MSYNSAYDLLGKKVSDTYPNLLQSGSDGVFYDGRGNSVTINATIPDIYVKYSQTGSFATTASNTFTGNQLISGSVNITSSFTASGLNYPSIDNGEFSFIQTDGNGNLSLQYVNTLYEVVYNGEATSMVKGTPIYISGSQGANSKAYQADAGNPLKMPVVYVTADTIAAGSTGRAIALGLITGVDTTGYPGGTEIYVAVGGGWTSTRPTGSAIVQVLGYVTKEGNGGQGVVLNPGPANLPNLPSGSVWVGNSGSVPVAISTSSLSVKSALTSSYPISASGTTIVSVLPGGISSGNNNSIFLGASAGSGVTSAYNSNFLGYLAGQSATFASQANFIGAGAGLEATRADNSNFFGLFAGQKAVSASFSTLIGYQAGANPDGTATIGTNNIIIGSNITLPASTRNSINLGGIIFATGSYSTLTGNPYSGSQFNIGRVGINKVLPVYTLDVSGSGNYSNGLTVTGSVIATSFTGSLLGTGSWAINSISSSNSTLLSGISSSQFARVDTDNTFNGVNTTTQKTLRTNSSYTIVETSYASAEIPPDTQPLDLFNVYSYVPYSTDKTFENTSLVFDYTMVSIDGLSIRSGRINLNWSPENAGADTVIDSQILTDAGISAYITFGYTVDYTPGNESVRLNVFNDSANSLTTVFIRGFLRII